VLRHANAEAYLIELDTSIEATISAFTPEDKAELITAVADMFVSTVSGIRSIVAERDSNNAADAQLLPVLPRHLVCLRMPDFNRLFERHSARLSKVPHATTMHQIGQAFVQLKRLYQTDDAVRALVDQSTDTKTTFEDGWALLGTQYPRLMQFCGDLATAFPNSATVDSDFSVMGWEKDVYRRSLTDFSLEGVLRESSARAPFTSVVCKVLRVHELMSLVSLIKVFAAHLAHPLLRAFSRIPAHDRLLHIVTVFIPMGYYCDTNQASLMRCSRRLPTLENGVVKLQSGHDDRL